MRDLTKGNEAKTLFLFTLPLLLGNIFQQLYTTVDSIVVGRGVGAGALGAVGASFPILFFMVSLVMGLTMGGSIMLSQYFGAKQFDKLKRTISTIYISMFWVSVAVSILGYIFTPAILNAINTPAAILPDATQYLRIMFIGMLFLFGYNMIGAVLRGLGDSKRPLYFLIISSLLNVGLDLLFVFVFHWGIAGAAWATVISQGVSMIIGIIYMQRSGNEVLHIHLKTLVFDNELFKTMLRIGLPMGIQHSLVSLGFIALTKIVNGFGTDAIAGYTAASRLDSFAAMPAMNISMALATFVGQNLGAGKPERVKNGFHAALGLGTTISLVMTAAMVIFAKPLVGMFTTEAGVIAIGVEYLHVVAPFYIAFSGMFIVAGIMRGAGDTMVQTVITLFALWGVRIPLSAFLATKFGTVGIWWGLPAGWILGASANYIYYLTGRWKKKVISKPHDGNDKIVVEEGVSKLEPSVATPPAAASGSD